MVKLTTDSEKALKTLQKRAEGEPTAKLISIRQDIENLKREIGNLEATKQQLTETVNAASDTLNTLDDEIIEADAIHKELLDKIDRTKKRHKDAERAAEFQVAIHTDLKNEIEDMKVEYDKLEASRIFSVQERGRLNKLSKAQQSKLDTVNNEIAEREELLRELQSRSSLASKQLKKIGEEDKVIREGLADKELKLQEDEDNLKSQKAEMKKDILAQQQLQPKLKITKPDNSKGYLKI